jgi:hypothetical protein
MDQDQSPGGPELSDAQRTPEQVREQIDQTRAELGDTVAALAEKTDVKAQTKQAVGGAKEAVAGSAGDAGERVKSFVAENRVAVVAVGGFALGWLIRSRTSR